MVSATTSAFLCPHPKSTTRFALSMEPIPMVMALVGTKFNPLKSAAASSRVIGSSAMIRVIEFI